MIEKAQKENEKNLDLKTDLRNTCFPQQKMETKTKKTVEIEVICFCDRNKTANFLKKIKYQQKIREKPFSVQTQSEAANSLNKKSK
jgi:hypothetical protein